MKREICILWEKPKAYGLKPKAKEKKPKAYGLNPKAKEKKPKA